MENTKPQASQIRYGSGDNTVDKALKRSVLSFSDYAAASTAAATLPIRQRIDVESDQKRYVANNGLLVFVENFLRSDLARSIGASLVGFAKPDGPAQTVQQHIDMLYFGVANIRDPQFAGGAKGTWNGVTGDDDTAAIQAALNSGARFIYAPPLESGFSYRLTSPVTISGNVSIIGAGASPYTKFIGTRGPGSWFHCDHGGRGFVIAGDGLLSGGPYWASGNDSDSASTCCWLDTSRSRLRHLYRQC